MLFILLHFNNHELHLILRTSTCPILFSMINTLVFLTTPDDKQVWAVLKPGFLALVADPMDSKLLDIIVFDVLPTVEEEGSQACLAYHVKERNPLRYSFKVCFLFFFSSSYFYSSSSVIQLIFCYFVQLYVIFLHDLFVNTPQFSAMS